MSDSFLAMAMSRASDSASTGSNPRQKISVLSEKVVDSNPYSRLMCVPCNVAGPTLTAFP